MKRLKVIGMGAKHDPAKTLCLNQVSALKKCDGVAHRLCDSERSCARMRALPGLGIVGKHVRREGLHPVIDAALGRPRLRLDEDNGGAPTGPGGELAADALPGLYCGLVRR